MIRPYLLSETNFEFLQKHKYELAILPWGATEAHNFHLPYGTDNYQVEAIAEESARLAWENDVNLVVLPNIPFGVNTGQSDIYLDMNLNPSTQLIILKDLITVLNRQGLKKLILLNGHGGNNFKPLLRELGYEFSEMFLSLCNWFQVPDKTLYFENPGDHADEMETSLMLHLYADLILDPSKWGSGKSKKHRVDAISSSWAWSERKWSKVTEDTGVGDPSKSSEEKGSEMFTALTKKLAGFYAEVDALNLEDQYTD